MLVGWDGQLDGWNVDKVDNLMVESMNEGDSLHIEIENHKYILVMFCRINAVILLCNLMTKL